MNNDKHWDQFSKTLRIAFWLFVFALGQGLWLTWHDMSIATAYPAVIYTCVIVFIWHMRKKVEAQRTKRD